MVKFDTYKIKSKELAKYIQYVLFNYCEQPSILRQITSFANTNICLGILKDQQIYCKADDTKAVKPKKGIHSYISGMYLTPHKFELENYMDEICIDFTPLGFYKFFSFPIKTYILDDDVLTEGFGTDAKYFFEHVFENTDFQQRGALIEAFLLKRLSSYENSFLQEAIHYIHTSKEDINLKKLSRILKCSEKKIIRAFTSHFDLTPKDYFRIVRFRRALKLVSYSNQNLTSIAYHCGYYDQSHFIKDLKFFTGSLPKHVRPSLHNIKSDLIVGLE